MHSPIVRLALLTLLVGAVLTACNSRDAHSTEAVEDQHEAGAPASNLLSVASDGSRFDPPVPSERIPNGAWMCDMGGVHYAALDQGDGDCPVCGMKLKQQHAQGSGGSGHEDEHEGHQH